MTAMTAAEPAAPDTRRPMTFEEFLDWCDEDTSAEWVDGKVQTYMSAAERHQALVGFLLSILMFWCEQQSAGRVLSGPYPMRLATRPSGREPDVMVVAAENVGRIGERFLDGPADIVIEIVSPESRRRDRQEKFFEYEAAGVREYWIYDPELDEAEFNRLDETGAFRRIAPDAAGVYHSAVLAGMTLDVNWLSQRPLPTLMHVLQNWKLV